MSRVTDFKSNFLCVRTVQTINSKMLTLRKQKGRWLAKCLRLSTLGGKVANVYIDKKEGIL